MTEGDQTPLDSRLHWYQRTGLWVALAGAAIPVALVVGLGNNLSVQSRVVGVLAVGVLGLAHLGLWMGALVARRRWARGMLSVLTLVVLGLLIWAVWNGLQDVEATAIAACELVDTADGQVVEIDPELCASVVSGSFDEEFDSLRRNMWIVVAATWIAPLFILYAMRRRFPPGRIETEASATTDLVVGILLMIVGLFIVLSFAIGFVYGPDVPEILLPVVLTVFVLLIAFTLVPGALLIRSARRLRRRLSRATEPSDQHQEEDTGLSGWTVAAVVLAAVALLSVPLWFLIQAALDADPTPAADVSGEETSEVAPLDDTDVFVDLRDQGLASLEDGMYEEALSSFNELIDRFREHPDPAVQALVAFAHIWKAQALEHLSRPTEALEILDEVIDRYGDSTDPDMHQPLAMAYFRRGVIFGGLGQEEEAIAAFSDFVAQYSDTPDPFVGQMVELAQMRASGPEGIWNRRKADFSVASPSVFFEDFSSQEGMTLVGSAVFVDDALSLTRKVEGRWQSGAAWYPERFNVADGFEAVFAFQIDHVSWFTIGHGFAFVIQNASANELGDDEGSGGSGYRTIPNSVAIEFDTVYQDYLSDPRPPMPVLADDPPFLLANHVAVHTKGTGPNSSHSRDSVAFSGLPILLADRQAHAVLVRYQDSQLTVFIDDFPDPVLSTTIDLNTLGLTGGAAFVGFTAGTGPGFYSDHRILGWALNSPCLTDDCAP